MIDTYIRLGDITLFKEEITEAIDSYKKAAELCKEFSAGNERILASTLFTIGCCFEQIQNYTEAGRAFSESIDALRSALFIKLAANNQPVADQSVPTENLLRPSIFDSDEIKDIRAFLQDVVEKLKETKEQERN